MKPKWRCQYCEEWSRKRPPQMMIACMLWQKPTKKDKKLKHKQLYVRFVYCRKCTHL